MSEFYDLKSITDFKRVIIVIKPRNFAKNIRRNIHVEKATKNKDKR